MQKPRIDDLSKENLNTELWRYFGAEGKYKGGLLDTQFPFVQQLLSGHDCFCVMATGGGKSLCYQLAGTLIPGVTIVVSPLIALIQQQTAELNKYHIPSVCIFREGDTLDETEEEPEDARKQYREETGWSSRRKAYLKTASGMVKFIFVTPERFRSAAFMVLLRRLPVNLLILDEVHCMSVWGHDFRRSYLEITRVIDSMEKRPIIGAFTATATKAVRKDIIELLDLRLTDSDGNEFSKESGNYIDAIEENYFNNLNTIREELTYNTIKIRSGVESTAYALRNTEWNETNIDEKLKENCRNKDYFGKGGKYGRDEIKNQLLKLKPGKLAEIEKKESTELEWNDKSLKLLKLIKKHKDSCGIIYCSSIANVNYVYERLFEKYANEKDVQVLKYHGRMEKSEKSLSLKMFCSKKHAVNLMVATNAFGMGIDKDDIRYVIHYNVPNSIENYYQEAGRAGRDHNHGDCYILYSWVFDKMPDSFYNAANRFKGYWYLYDIVRRSRIMTFIHGTNKGKPDFINEYFKNTDFKDLLEKQFETSPETERKRKPGEKEVKVALESLEILENLEKELLEKELRMPPNLFVNRTLIAENIRKGIYKGDNLRVSRKPKEDTPEENNPVENPPEEKNLPENKTEENKTDKITDYLTVHEKIVPHKQYPVLENHISYRLKYDGKPYEDKSVAAENKLTYFDMMVADAVYTLMLYKIPICAKNIFVVLCGNPYIELTKSKKEIIDKSVKKMIKTEIQMEFDFKNPSQGIFYDNMQYEYEKDPEKQGFKEIYRFTPFETVEGQFLPLEDPKTKNSAYKPILKTVFIKRPEMAPLQVQKRASNKALKKVKRNDTDYQLPTLKKKVEKLPPLYEFAEGMMQFYFFETSKLNMEGEDWLLRKTPNCLEKYCNAFAEIPGWNWSKGKFMNELYSLYDLFNPDETLEVKIKGEPGFNIQSQMGCRANYSVENVILTHYLLRRVDTMLSQKRVLGDRNVISNTVKLYDEKNDSYLFETLFQGIQNDGNQNNKAFEKMDKYTKKRKIQNLLTEGKGVDAVLSRMKYVGIIRDFVWSEMKTRVKLVPSAHKYSAVEIRDNYILQYQNEKEKMRDLVLRYIPEKETETHFDKRRFIEERDDLIPDTDLSFTLSLPDAVKLEEEFNESFGKEKTIVYSFASNDMEIKDLKESYLEVFGNEMTVRHALPFSKAEISDLKIKFNETFKKSYTFKNLKKKFDCIGSDLLNLTGTFLEMFGTKSKIKYSVPLRDFKTDAAVLDFFKDSFGSKKNTENVRQILPLSDAEVFTLTEAFFDALKFEKEKDPSYSLPLSDSELRYLVDIAVKNSRKIKRNEYLFSRRNIEKVRLVKTFIEILQKNGKMTVSSDILSDTEKLTTLSDSIYAKIDEKHKERREQKKEIDFQSDEEMILLADCFIEKLSGNEIIKLTDKEKCNYMQSVIRKNRKILKIKYTSDIKTAYNRSYVCVRPGKQAYAWQLYDSKKSSAGTKQGKKIKCQVSFRMDQGRLEIKAFT